MIWNEMGAVREHSNKYFILVLSSFDECTHCVSFSFFPFFFSSVCTSFFSLSSSPVLYMDYPHFVLYMSRSFSFFPFSILFVLAQLKEDAWRHLLCVPRLTQSKRMFSIILLFLFLCVYLFFFVLVCVGVWIGCPINSSILFEINQFDHFDYSELNLYRRIILIQRGTSVTTMFHSKDLYILQKKQ